MNGSQGRVSRRSALPRPSRSTYAKAGVGIARIHRGHRKLAKVLQGTFPVKTKESGQVLLGIGHYAGLVSLGWGMALALHSDGVGTKVIVAQRAEKFDTVGIDCVAMNVNDVICVGARPIAFVDYLALREMDEDLVGEIAKGLAEGGRLALTPVVGGETAVMPDLFSGGEKAFDLAGTVAGLVRKNRIITGESVAAGDMVLGVESSGLHSNGYSLVRKVMRDHIEHDLKVHELGRPLLDELLEPTRIYVQPVLKLIRNVAVHGLAHVTGGAYTKLNRLVGRKKLGFRLEYMPDPPAIFKAIQRLGRVSTREMYRTFNMGIGLCVVLPKESLDEASSVFESFGMKSHAIGTATSERGVYLGATRLD